MRINAKRTLAAILAGLMLLPMAACGTSKDDPDETREELTGYEDETGDPDFTCDLPKDLNFDNTEVVILYVDHDGREDEFVSEKMGLGILSDAVYERNVTVENALGVKFGYVDVPDDGGATSKASTMVSAGDKSVDIFTMGSFMAITNALSGYYLDLNHMYYMDTTKHYWSQDYNEISTFTDKNMQFLATSSAAISMFRLSFLTIFNKSLAEEWKVPDIYAAVDNGEWTLDFQYQITTNIYADSDGNGRKSEGDLFGHITGSNKNMDCYPAAADVNLITRNEDGDWYFNKDEQGKMITMSERVGALMTSPGTYAHDFGDDIGDYYTIEKFSTETGLTATTNFLSIEKYIGELADIDYGIAPIPKLSVDQEKYHTYVNDQVTSQGISSAIGDEQRQDVVGAVLEAIAYYSYLIVRPAYYDNTLSLRFMSDEHSSEILDLMFDALAFDYGYYHYGGLGGIKSDLRSMLPRSNPGIASHFKVWEKKVNTTLESERKSIDRLLEQWSDD